MKNTPLQAFYCCLCVIVGAAHLLAQPMPNAQTIHETGQQYKEGNPLIGASDNMAIGSQAREISRAKTRREDSQTV